MKKRGFLLMLVIGPCCAMVMAQGVVSAAAYGVGPSGKASPALRRAVEACVRTGAKVLSLPGGRIDLWPEGAVEKELYISNATEDDTLSKVKHIGMCFERARHLRVEGNNTLLVLHGKMVSFALLGCEDVVVRNVRVDCQRPTMSEMRILSVGAEQVTVTLHPDSRYRIDDSGNVHFYGEGWETREFFAIRWDSADEAMRYISFEPFLQARATSVGPGLVRFTGDFSKAGLHAGEVLTIRDPYRDNAGVFIDESRDVRLSNLDMYYMHGLGIVSQYSGSLRVRFMHPQTWGFPAFYPGDSIAYVNPRTLLPMGYGVVRRASMVSRCEMDLWLEGGVAGGVGVGDCVENIRWWPRRSWDRASLRRRWRRWSPGSPGATVGIGLSSLVIVYVPKIGRRGTREEELRIRGKKMR